MGACGLLLSLGAWRGLVCFITVPHYAEQIWSFSPCAIMQRLGSSAFRYNKGRSPTMGGRVGPSAAEGREANSEKLLCKMPGALWSTLCTPPHSHQDADCARVTSLQSRKWVTVILKTPLSLVPVSQNAPWKKEVVGTGHVWSPNLIFPLHYHYTNCSWLIILVFLMFVLNPPSLITSLWT